MAAATCASVPAATPDSTARRECTSARRFPALMVPSSSLFLPPPHLSELPLAPPPPSNSCNWKQRGTTGIGGNLVSIVLRINTRQLRAAACKCRHSSLRLLMKGDKYPAQAGFLSSCKHGGLWGWENNTQCCGHTVDSMEMCELRGPRLSGFEMLDVAMPCHSYQQPLLLSRRWSVSDPRRHACVQLPRRIHGPALRDQHQRVCR